MFFSQNNCREAFFGDEKSHILANSKDKQYQKSAFFLCKSALFSQKKNTIWLATSGTAGQIKWVALSKEALLYSAKAVNSFLDLSKKDIWGLALPLFHVGGLSVLARAFLSKSRVIFFPNKWNPEFIKPDLKITALSLVPAQVYDIVKRKILPPKKLRFALVGGGILENRLYMAAKELGWPILITYGMTECASQIATEDPENPCGMRLLPHWEAKADKEGFLNFKGKALFDGYAIWQNGAFTFFDPKKEGWFCSEDKGKISGRFLEVFGRGGDFIKILGENVSLFQLRQKWKEASSICDFPSMLVARNDARKGGEIVLKVNGKKEAFSDAVKDFNREFPSYLHIKEIVEVEGTLVSWKDSLISKEPI